MNGTQNPRMQGQNPHSNVNSILDSLPNAQKPAQHSPQAPNVNRPMAPQQATANHNMPMQGQPANRGPAPQSMANQQQQQQMNQANSTAPHQQAPGVAPSQG